MADVQAPPGSGPWSPPPIRAPQGSADAARPFHGSRSDLTGASAGGATGWQWAAASLAWLGGVALQLLQASLVSDTRWLAWACVGAALCAGWGWRRCSRATLASGRAAARVWGRVGATFALCAGLAGLGWATTEWRAHLRLAEALPAALEGQDLHVVGVVDAMPRAGPIGTRFRVRVEQAHWRGRPAPVPTRLLLSWYAPPADQPGASTAGTRVRPAESTPALRAGQRWSLTVRLKRPHGMLNPGGFDGELWLWEQGVRATGYVRDGRTTAAPPMLLDAQAGYPVERARGSLRDAIVHAVDPPRVAALVAALVVGDQAGLEREDWEVFRLTGVAHLVSISGVHVTMFAWLAGVVVGWAWRRSHGLMHRLPAPLAARWGGLAAAAAYALLAGWGVPAERTLLMLAIAVGLRSLGLRWPWLLVCGVTAVAVTLRDPWALLQPGFWLSFAAVALLMLSEPVGRPPARTGWAAAPATLLRSQVVATVGLAPLSLVFFQQISLVGFLANLVSIPLVTLALTPLALGGAVVPLLWQPAAWLGQAWLAGLAWLASWPWATWSVPTAPGWAVVAGLAAAVVGLVPLHWRVRILAPLLALPLVWPAVPRPRAGTFELLAADVGQGTAVLVRTRQHLLLYDTGPAWASESNAGERLLLPLLRTRGERAIDRLVLSHGDTDHVGGAESVLTGLPVLSSMSTLPAAHALRTTATLPLHQPCSTGVSWHWDSVRFEVLHPGAAALGDARRSPNSLSCVLAITDANGRRALLTGDLEAAQEAELVARLGPSLRSEVLLVPHHGSRTSSSEAFLDAVAPEVAVVQAAYRSRFGHPAPQVVQRYAERGIQLVRTDHCGAWLWHDGAHACVRAVNRRYWHWSPASDPASPRGAAGPDVAYPPQGASPQ
ncbi:MAG: DNA internalization-related competence protein ComEC/Rec2 [Aquabacterium sp.]|nr:DNA internalization-related competence protein ComEC/Rec2 [Aquabacterium sp.]